MNGNNYFIFWNAFLGFDIADTQSNRTLTKGEFFRLHTAIADRLNDKSQLPSRFKLVKRLPFVPFVERHGKKYELAE